MSAVDDTFVPLAVFAAERFAPNHSPCVAAS